MNITSESTEDSVHILAVPQMKVTGRIGKSEQEVSLKKSPFKTEVQNPFSVAQELFNEISKVGTVIMKEWNGYVTRLTSNNESITTSLMKDHSAQLRKDLNKFVLRSFAGKPSESQIERMRLGYTKKFRPAIHVLTPVI
eukprot:TRINITY_DN4005_c0_g1_i11.p4 TRINITY_DN4005_c0_g1~~TRINITY_DN4005_c0_g1_i11.p4  ORF type:complete len:139 (-),score=32.03 TRINITY_DN4005_c0_g1_i11:1088-1504(-)